MVMAPRTILTADFLATAMFMSELFVLVCDCSIAAPLDARTRRSIKEFHCLYMQKPDCQASETNGVKDKVR